MKVVILAGGLGSRLSEETHAIPKPMVEVGGRPILWHIMMQYSNYGFTDFFVALGYKGDQIKRYFSELRMIQSDLTIHPASGDREYHPSGIPEWRIDLIETGERTMTGGRLKRLSPYLEGGTFMLTYGDGVSDLDLRALLAFHRAHGRLATVTAVRPIPRFGHLELDGDRVVEFSEKFEPIESWINGAYFVLEPGVLDYIAGDHTEWEREPMDRLAREGQLMAYRHDGFWQCMDTYREKKILESLWESGEAPWKTWED